jgi:hypothetical protein
MRVQRLCSPTRANELSEDAALIRGATVPVRPIAARRATSRTQRHGASRS